MQSVLVSLCTHTTPKIYTLTKKCSPSLISEQDAPLTLHGRHSLVVHHNPIVQLLQCGHPRGNHVHHLALRHRAAARGVVYSRPVAHDCETRDGGGGQPDLLVDLLGEVLDGGEGGVLNVLWVLQYTE